MTFLGLFKREVDEGELVWGPGRSSTASAWDSPRPRRRSVPASLWRTCAAGSAMAASATPCGGPGPRGRGSRLRGYASWSRSIPSPRTRTSAAAQLLEPSVPGEIMGPQMGPRW